MDSPRVTAVAGADRNPHLRIHAGKTAIVNAMIEAALKAVTREAAPDMAAAGRQNTEGAAPKAGTATSADALKARMAVEDRAKVGTARGTTITKGAARAVSAANLPKTMGAMEAIARVNGIETNRVVSSVKATRMIIRARASGVSGTKVAAAVRQAAPTAVMGDRNARNEGDTEARVALGEVRAVPGETRVDTPVLNMVKATTSLMMTRAVPIDHMARGITTKRSKTGNHRARRSTVIRKGKNKGAAAGETNGHDADRARADIHEKMPAARMIKRKTIPGGAIATTNTRTPVGNSNGK